MYEEDLPDRCDDRRIMQAAIDRAFALGASVAGFVPARLLRDCPSSRVEGYRNFATGKIHHLISFFQIQCIGLCRRKHSPCFNSHSLCRTHYSYGDLSTVGNKY